MPIERSDPRLLVLGGAMRSGTTLLRDILKTHPLIRLPSLELRALDYVGVSAWMHLAGVLKHSLSTRERIRHGEFQRQAFRYLAAIGRTSAFSRPVTVSRIRSALASALADSDTRYVGDKYPNYVLRGADYVEEPRTVCVFTYRDARDVVASLVERTQRGPWRGRRWAEMYNSVDKATAYWLSVMRAMNEISTRSNVRFVRYEDLVLNPQSCIDSVAQHLGLPPAGFDVTLPQPSNIGRYRERLTAADIRSIERRAGAVLQAWGYEP